MAAPELRPMGIGDILDTTFRLYKSHFSTYTSIALLAYVPFSLMLSIYQISTGFGSQNPIRQLMEGQAVNQPPLVIGVSEFRWWVQPGRFEVAQDAPSPNIPGLLIGGLGTFIFAVVFLPWCQAALVHNISATYLGEDLGAVPSYRRAGPRVFRFVISAILVGLVSMLGCCMLVVPGIIFWLWFALVGPVIMLEDLGPIAAMSRSRQLMSGNLGKAFLLGFVVGLLSFFFQVFIMAFQAFIPWPHLFLEFFVPNVLGVLLLPIQLAPTILLYYDIRIRKEAFDLMMLANAVGRPIGP